MANDTRNNILPECFVDTCVCEILLMLDGKKLLNKKHGVGKVAHEFYHNPKSTVRRITKPMFIDSPALAVIDLDKLNNDASDFFRDGKHFTNIAVEGSLILKQHKVKKYHYAIVVNPVMERFLLKCAGDVGITTNEYKFLKDLPSLQLVSKSRNIREDKVFKKFVKELVKRECGEILTLKDWLQQFYQELKIEV